MKKYKRIILTILTITTLSLVCPSTVPFIDAQTTVEAAQKIKLNKKKITLIKGQTTTLKITGTTSKVKWSSSQKQIASVNSKGKVTAKKKGSATITATVKNKKYTCKVTVETPAINKKSINLAPKNTYKLKITGTTQSVKWSSNNTDIVKVSKSGTVTAVSDGVAKITATIGTKKYTCKVTVSSKPSASNISYTLYDMEKGVVAIIKNNNPVATSISPTMVFYNGSKKMIGTRSNYNYCLEPNSECALFFYAPWDEHYNEVPYSSYKLNLNVEESLYDKYAANKISVTSNKGASGVVANVKNKSSYDLDTIQLAIVYYNASGKCIGYDYLYADCKKPKSSDYITFAYPYDDNYETIMPSKYKIYVNHAYKYW